MADQQFPGGTPPPPPGGTPPPPPPPPAWNQPPPPQGGGPPYQQGYQSPPPGYQPYPPQQGYGYPSPGYSPPPGPATNQPAGAPSPGMGYPPAGMPPPPMGGAQPPAPPGPPKPPAPPANFQLGALLPKELKIPVQKHPLQFDEKYFIRLLAGSISLTKDEKIRIIDSIPKLRQGQIDELIRIFEEEKRKFAELSAEHVPQLERLARQHYEDWVDIEMHYAQAGKKEQEAQQAEDLRKKLGLN